MTIRVHNPQNEPVLLYDGDCSFCRKWMLRGKWWIGDRIRYRPFQEVANDFPELPPERLGAEIHFIDADGHVYTGAAGTFRALQCAPHFWLKLPWAFYRHVPLFAPLSEMAYRWIARRR